MRKTSERDPAQPGPEMEQPGPEQAAAGGNPFDLASMRLDQDFDKVVGVRRVLSVIEVRKPGRQEFFRVHPDPAFQVDTALLVIKEGVHQEFYQVAAALWAALYDDVGLYRLVTAINRRGGVFLWPLRLPASNSREDGWMRSALDAMERSKEHWFKLQADTAAGSYDLYEAKAAWSDPIWPDYTFQQLLDIAFRNYRILTLDHPVIHQLHGTG